ncbi:hypothetical protein lmo4a_0452 [Listeria monocytogenes L99]|nr:hypothetical protein lmo4a_0452 [Listeria monocytogenes L99]
MGKNSYYYLMGFERGDYIEEVKKREFWREECGA